MVEIIIKDLYYEGNYKLEFIVRDNRIIMCDIFIEIWYYKNSNIVLLKNIRNCWNKLNYILEIKYNCFN